MTTTSDGLAAGNVEASTPAPGMNGPTTGTATSRPGSIGMLTPMGTIRQPPSMVMPRVWRCALAMLGSDAASAITSQICVRSSWRIENPVLPFCTV